MHQLSTPMLPNAARNLLVALVVALPIAIVGAIVVTSIVLPPWAEGRAIWGSIGDLPGAFLFWYLTLAIPTLLLASLHQLLLAVLPKDWPPRYTRLAILGGAFGIGLCLAWFALARSTEAHLPGIVGMILPAVLAYGLLARPLRSAGPEQVAG